MTSDERHEHISTCYQQDLALIRLWILAEKLLIGRLQNLVIKIMNRIRSSVVQ